MKDRCLTSSIRSNLTADSNVTNCPVEGIYRVGTMAVTHADDPARIARRGAIDNGYSLEGWRDSFGERSDHSISTAYKITHSGKVIGCD